MKIYLAGKIRPTDWRHELVKGFQLRDAVRSIEDWKKVLWLPMTTGDQYVGPFFIACDHRCSHGANAHGAGIGLYGCFGGGVPQRHVREKATAGIQACDLFIAYLGTDFGWAYGTMVEIGVAHAWGKPIVLVIDPNLDTKDFWFLKTMANRIVMSDNPIDAVYSVLTQLKQSKQAEQANIKAKHTVITDITDPMELSTPHTSESAEAVQRAWSRLDPNGRPN